MKRIVMTVLSALTAAAVFGFTSEYNTVKQLYDQQQGAGAAAQTQQQPQTQPQTQQYQQMQQPQQQKKTDAGDVVVTARKINEETGLVTRVVDTIKEETLVLYGAMSAADALDFIQGIMVNRTGPLAGMSNMWFRGAPSKYTLLMIDGVPLNDIQTGGADLSMIDIWNLGKIEVVKGGMSAIYGGDAAAGVVNIIKGGDKALVKGAAVYGTNNYRKFNIGSNYSVFNLDYSVSAFQEIADDYFENSDFKKEGFDARLSFGKEFYNKISASYVKRETGVPFGDFGATPLARQYDETWSAALESAYALDFMDVKLSGYARSNDMKFKDEDIWWPVDARHIKKEYSATLFGRYDEGGFFSSVAGLEWTLRTIESTVYDEKENSNTAVYTSNSAKIGDLLVINAAGRVDTNSQYGVKTSESLSARVRLEGNVEVKGTMEKSFKSPSFSDIYWPESVYYYYDDFSGNTLASIMQGNPDIKPEDASSFEVYVSKKDGKLTQSVCWYYREIDNMINWGTEVSGLTSTTKPVNIEKAKVTGLEVKAEIQPLDFWFVSAQFNMTYIEDANNNTGGAFTFGGNDTGRNYRVMTWFKLPYDLKLALTGEYVEYKKDVKGKDIDPYFVMDAKLSQKLNKQIDIYVQVNNALDNRDYQIIKGYPMPGRTVYGGVEVVF